MSDFDLNAGTTDFYQDVAYYDHEFKNRKADVRWYAQRYVDAGSPVLEMAVGSGRIALKAVRQGAQVVGVDLAQPMLDMAEKQRQKLPAGKRDGLTLIQGDMRSFDLGQTFDLVTCPFNAFQHMYTREDAERCLAVARRHLKPDGTFIMDILTPDLEYLLRSPYKKYQGVRFLHPTHRSFYTYSEQSAYDPVSQINQMWFHYDRCNAGGQGPESYVIQLSHRYYFPQEIKAMLHYNGFEIVQIYGDFEEGPLEDESESIVLVCRLSESSR